MKKIALCAAVTAICVAPAVSMAAADIYGQLRYSVNSVDADGGTGSDGMVAADNVSLFGLKASTEGDGIKAFVHLQTGANADPDGDGKAFQQRFYFGGLTGGFGTVAYGRMTNAYKFAGFAMDPFYNHSHINVNGSFAAGGGTYGLSPATNGFTNNAVQYTSPAMSGLKVNLGLYIDDGGADDHGTNIGAVYNKDGIQLGFQMASEDKADTIPGVITDGDAMRLYGGYKADKYSVSLSFETLDDSATTEATYMFLAAKFKVAAKTEVAATLGTVSADAGSPTAAKEGTGITAGIFQTVAPQTQVFVSTSMVSLDAAGAAEPSVISLGAIHKF